MQVLILFIGVVAAVALRSDRPTPSSRLLLLLCCVTAAAMMTHRLA